MMNETDESHNGDHVVEGTTCFSTHETNNVCCMRKQCPQWIPHNEGNNCAIISAKCGMKTFQEIGNIYGISRTRVHQIMKSIIDQIKDAS